MNNIFRILKFFFFTCKGNIWVALWFTIHTWFFLFVFFLFYFRFLEVAIVKGRKIKLILFLILRFFFLFGLDIFKEFVFIFSNNLLHYSLVISESFKFQVSLVIELVIFWILLLFLIVNFTGFCNCHFFFHCLWLRFLNFLLF